MSKSPKRPYISPSEKKKEQAASLFKAAGSRYGEISESAASEVEAVACALAAEGEAAARKEAAAKPPILVLPPNATEDELGKGRRRQAVQRGEDVYLPICGDDSVVMPLCFVRSSLFPAAATSTGEAVSKKTILTLQPKISIRLSGPELLPGDRRVFAACLAHYRNRPLAAGDNGEWVETSYHELGQSVGLGIGKTTISAIGQSLVRLAQVKLVVREDGYDFCIPSLVDFARQHAGEKQRKIKIRIRQDLAALYGKNHWWKIPLSLFSLSKLTGWIACFYASHPQSHWLSTSKLHELSGLSCKLTDFEGRLLLNALKGLEDKGVHKVARVVKVNKTWGKESTEDKQKNPNDEPNRIKTRRIEVITAMMHEGRRDANTM